ncbi:MAG: TIGR02281 family clan AA aspartic protease [Usitatibacter sp.]
MLAALLAAPGAFAIDVNVIGLFPGKAVIVVNRGAPRTLSIGQSTAEGVKLISSDSRTAVFEVDGKRQTLEMGQHFESAAPAAGGGRSTVVLSPDTRGHFITDGQVNGGYVRFLVDTGATLVSLSAAEASRLGIDYRNGEPIYSIVADGRRVPSYRIKLDSVAVGDITIFGVEASVREGGGSALLGMSFLNRTEMRREGQNLTLTKRY